MDAEKTKADLDSIASATAAGFQAYACLFAALAHGLVKAGTLSEAQALDVMKSARQDLFFWMRDADTDMAAQIIDRVERMITSRLSL